jgi:hypothetical protein
MLLQRVASDFPTDFSSDRTGRFRCPVRRGIGCRHGRRPRRFPAPWRADKSPGGYVVRDADGQALAYVYSRQDPNEARQAKVLTADEARPIASNIARLPELLGKAERAIELRTARPVI